MTFQKILSLPLIAVSLAVSTACAAKPSPNGYLKTQAIQATTQAKVQANHVHGELSKTSNPQQYFKPGAAISYEHNLPADIVAGQTVSFQLFLDESYDTGNMSVSLTSDGDLQVFPSSSYANFDMSAGRQHVMDVSITAGSNGRHYLNVQAEANDGRGQSMPRIFSIAVQVGPSVKMAPHSKMTKTSSGENIIMMEADEVIE